MTDNKYSFDNGQLSEYSQFIYNQLLEGLATISNIEKNSISKFPEIEGKIDPEVEEVFNLLLKRIITIPKVTSPKRFSRQQASNIWNKIAPTFLIQLSLIGCIFCFFAAILSKLISPVVAPAVTYLTLSICFLAFFVLLWEIRWIRQFKSSEKEAETNFQKYRDNAVTLDWQVINEIVEAANYKKKILQYVENKVWTMIEKQQDNLTGLDKFLKLVAIFIVVCAVGIFYPTYFQILADHILSGNISLVSASLAVLLVVGSGIVLIYEAIFYSQSKVRISTYKMCFYLLKQAQLVVDSKSNEQSVRV